MSCAGRVLLAKRDVRVVLGPLLGGVTRHGTEHDLVAWLLVHRNGCHRVRRRTHRRRTQVSATRHAHQPHAALRLVPIGTGFLSFRLWVYHMYPTGLPGVSLGLFSAALLAGLYYFYPIVADRLLSERLGKMAFWLMFIGFNVTFMPMHVNRSAQHASTRLHLSRQPGSQRADLLSTVGAFILAAGRGLALLPSRRRGGPARDAVHPRDRRKPVQCLRLPGPSLLPLLSAVTVGGFFVFRTFHLWATAIASMVIGTGLISYWLWTVTAKHPEKADTDVGLGLRLGP